MPNSSQGSQPQKPDLSGVRFVEVTQETRARFESLFEQPGAPKYCWCMAWCHSSREHVQNDEKKRMMMALIDAGTPVGIVAELDGKPVGWCSVAPRETYRKLSRQQDDSETGIWSIVCFYVPRALRGGGLASVLLDAAIDHLSRATALDPARPDAANSLGLALIQKGDAKRAVGTPCGVAAMR